MIATAGRKRTMRRLRAEQAQRQGPKHAPSQAGMAELADAADSKSAGTWYLGGSIPPPGTILLKTKHLF